MKTKKIVVTAVFAALTAVFAQLAVPLPFSPVPVSLSLFAVFLCGAVLPMREALLSQLVYVLLGTVGVPVFAGFSGGLMRPTWGYLLAYPLIALLTACGVRLAHGKSRAVWVALTAAFMLLSLAVCYTLGCLWFAFYTRQTVAAAFALTVTPFVPFDLMKAVAAAAISIPLNKALQKL